MQYRARQIMTRADFLEELDKVNIIAMDVSLFLYLKEYEALLKSRN